VGGIANLVAIPLFEFVIVPLALAGALLGALWLPAGSVLLGAAAKVLVWLWPLLEWAAALPHAYVPVPEPSLWVLVLALAGVALLLAPRGIPARWLGAVMIAPLALAPQPRPAPGGFNLTLLDVGQGLAAVVRTHAHTLIFDTGPSFASGSDTGALVVVPYLHSRGIVHPDLLIVSHGDDDHAGGVRSVLKAFPQLPVVTSAHRRFPAAAACVAGKHWQWDGVYFRMLNPAVAEGDGSDNNRSCVLKIDAAGGSALLTGDIEAVAERRLVEHDARLLRSDILIAPHHGSATSSTAEFIQAVAPRYVLFPVGYRNRWHFPRPAVAARYRAAGAKLFGTAACGAITFHVAVAVAFAGAWRTDHRHFWTRDGKSCE
jgi:competence protein ComEC